MHILVVAVLALLGSGAADAAAATRRPVAALHPVHITPHADKATLERVKHLEQTMDAVARQLMQQQTFVEERIRSDGQSGIKKVRLVHQGTKSYHGDNHIGGSALGTHDHTDFDRTIGLGEFVAVMNGVEFRTRHNDYKFKMPARSHNYNEVVDVPFPNVPPAVTRKHTLQEQIVEMREWFKAFKDQDHSRRDYRRFFKPNLCYLEGGWTLNAKTIDEPFQSDRHHLDAASWFDLQEKIRFTSYGGSKSNLENFAFLPTIMYNITDGIPQLAQWNYRILCHPLKQDVPTAYFELQDDLSNRMARHYRWDKVAASRAARFKLNEYGTQRFNYYSFLDGLMAEVPGKDNYGANLTDEAFGLMNYDIADPSANKVLNTGMYHRWFKLAQKGAMGLTVNHRGYHDENMWVAMTTQKNIMPMSIKHQNKWATRRVTYAIPLEIVYSTPLSKWNPYDIQYHDDGIHGYRIAIAGGRNGQPGHAFNGTSYKNFYQTPIEFYKDGSPTQRDKADTSRTSVHVLNKKGEEKKVAPGGFRTITPEIQDVGKIRLRYPIFPVHDEGSTIGQELSALKDMVMQMGRYNYLYEETPMGQALPADEPKTFHLRDSYKNPPGLHGHDFTLSAAEYKSLIAGNDTAVTTSFNLGHQHQLLIYQNKGNHKFYFKTCDGLKNCWDGHSHELTMLRT